MTDRFSHTTSPASSASGLAPAEIPNEHDLAILSTVPDCGWRQLMRVLLVAWVTCCLTGCSLFLMANRMFFGDPWLPSDFETFTKVRLEESDKKILILCSAPHTVRSDIGSLELDVIYGVTRILKRNDITVIDPEKVGTWMDDHGGEVMESDFDELGEQFDADYIAHIELDEFKYRMEKSPDLFQGVTGGEIQVYQVSKIDGITVAEQVFTRPYDSKFPKNNPRTAEQVSAVAFQKTFTERMTEELARIFHGYRVSDTVE